MITNLLRRGWSLLLAGILSFVKTLFFLPLPLMPVTLNFMLQDFADSFNYTRKDMEESPYAYSAIGWVLLLILTAILSPIALFFRNVWESTLLTSMVMFGVLFWVVVTAFALQELGTFLKGLGKKLTSWILSYTEVDLGLPPDQLTDNDRSNLRSAA